MLQVDPMLPLKMWYLGQNLIFQMYSLKSEKQGKIILLHPCIPLRSIY